MTFLIWKDEFFHRNDSDFHFCSGHVLINYTTEKEGGKPFFLKGGGMLALLTNFLLILGSGHRAEGQGTPGLPSYSTSREGHFSPRGRKLFPFIKNEQRHISPGTIKCDCEAVLRCDSDLTPAMTSPKDDRTPKSML